MHVCVRDDEGNVEQEREGPADICHRKVIRSRAALADGPFSMLHRSHWGSVDPADQFERDRPGGDQNPHEHGRGTGWNMVTGSVLLPVTVSKQEQH